MGGLASTINAVALRGSALLTMVAVAGGIKFRRREVIKTGGGRLLFISHGGIEHFQDISGLRTSR